MKQFYSIFFVLCLISCSSESSSPDAPKDTATSQKKDGKSMDVEKLKIETLKEGKGEEAKSGHIVTVHYTGTLLDGTKFDSSLDRGQPFTFPLGGGQVIKGWDEGVAGMKIGEKRRLTIPSSMGYGPRGAGNAIPPNAGLIFEVELISTKSP